MQIAAGLPSATRVTLTKGQPPKLCRRQSQSLTAHSFAAIDTVLSFHRKPLRYRSCRTLKTRKTCWCKWSDIRFACCASPAVIPSASQASTVNRDERATLMLNIQATTSLPVAADHSPLSSPLSSKLKKKVAKAAWKTRKAQC